jgi:nicotinamide riboside kinase
MQTHNLATDTSKTAQIALGAHATAIHDNSRVGKIAIIDGSLPMRLHARLFKGEANPFQKATIVDLCFAGDVQRSGKSCAELGFYVSDL